MSIDIKVVMAQLNFLVGDIRGNLEKMRGTINRAVDDFQADVILFPELCLTGYPAEDLLLRNSMDIRIENALKEIQQLSTATKLRDIYIIIGYPKNKWGHRYNAAAIINNGSFTTEYFKQYLPNYNVFDEKRYFKSGHLPVMVRIKNVPVSLTICEDIWEKKPIQGCKDAGAHLVFNLCASPYNTQKIKERCQLLKTRSKESNLSIVCVNHVGGQDELVFDGSSIAVDHQGTIKVQAPAFEEGLFPVTINYDPILGIANIQQGKIVEPKTTAQEVYEALVLGVRDYVEKNGFSGVVLGLSGGIDSAVTLAIAVDALGPKRVTAVMMPYHYTSQISLEDAKEQALIVDAEYHVIPIEPMVKEFYKSLTPYFYGKPEDATEENIQARCRGIILMGLSNKHHDLVLTTGNKSELAVGYATLYGDMAGGFDVLKDVSKTLVYELARYRNSITPIIPERVIEREPSAELRPDQVDSDSLPPYSLLDDIIEKYVEQDYSANDLIQAGFDPQIVQKIIRLIDQNEYKRKQSAVGVRVSPRGFGRDRRYPTTSGWSLMD